jgi:AraC-like DNA-binding protein
MSHAAGVETGCCLTLEPSLPGRDLVIGEAAPWYALPARACSLVDRAAVAGMSRARFAARFREVVGMTPAAQLSEWRSGLAQSLPRKGRPVQLVADVVGYGSASALSRTFRAHTGQTPTEWVGRTAPDWRAERAFRSR